MSSEYSNAVLVMLAEKEAKRVSYVENKFTGDKVLVRKFSAPSDKDEALGLKFAGLYVSAKNYDPSQVTHAEHTTIVDPEADGVVYSGTWKLLRLEKPPVKAGEKEQGIYETLRIWPVVTSSGVSAANCRFRTTVAWYWGLTLAQAEAYMVVATTAQGTDVRIEGPQKGDDGYSVWIYTTIRTQQTISEFISAIDTLSTQRTQEVIGSTSGTTLVLPSAIQGTMYAKTTDKNEDCTFNEKRTSDTSTAKTVGPVMTADSIVDQEKTTDYLNSRTHIPSPASVQGTVYNARMRMERDGTYSGPLVQLVSKALTIGPVVTGDSMLEQEQTSDYLNARTRPTCPSGVQGYMYRGTSRLERDGTYSGPQVSIYSKPVTVGPVKTADSITAQQLTSDYMNSREAFAAPDGVQGYMYRADPKMNPDGTYSGAFVQDLSKALTIGPIITRQDALGTTYDTIYHASRDTIAAPANVQASVYDADNRLNPDGTYGGGVTQRTSKQIILSKTPIEDHALAKTEESIYINSLTRPSAPAAVQGTVYGARSDMNPDGTYGGAQQETTSKAVTIGPVTTGERLSVSTYESQYLNARTLQSIAQAQGSMFARSVDYLRDGTYNERIDEQRGKSVEFNITIASSPDETVYLYDKKNMSSMPAGASDTAVLHEERYEGVDLNDFQLYDSRLILRIKKLPNSGTAVSWTNTLRKQWFKSGGALIQQSYKEDKSIGWTTSASAATAAATAVASHSGGIVSGDVNYSGNGSWSYTRSEYYWV